MNSAFDQYAGFASCFSSCQALGEFVPMGSCVPSYMPEPSRNRSALRKSESMREEYDLRQHNLTLPGSSAILFCVHHSLVTFIRNDGVMIDLTIPSWRTVGTCVPGRRAANGGL